VGAALAAVCLWWGPVRTTLGRHLLGLAGVVGAVGIVVMWRVVPESSALTFHGGFALLAVATAGVIACVTLLVRHPVAGILSVQPLPYLGKISYGMYLWYWPVLLVMTAQRTHLHGVALLGARLAVIVSVAALSFHLVETPIHRGRLAGWRSLVLVPLGALVVSLLPLMMPSASAVVPAVPPGGAKAALPFSSGKGAAAPVAAAHPGLTVVAAHFGWPWQMDLIAMALHKTNVFIDISGWSPRRIPPEVIRELNGRLSDQFVWGSDYPFIAPERCLAELDGLGIKPDALEAVLRGNATRILRR